LYLNTLKNRSDDDDACRNVDNFPAEVASSSSDCSYDHYYWTDRVDNMCGRAEQDGGEIGRF
jgi:hypothetical protein